MFCSWSMQPAAWQTVGKLTCPSSPALVHLGERRKQEMGHCEWIETERNTTDWVWMCFPLCEIQLIHLTYRKCVLDKTLWGTQCERFIFDPLHGCGNDCVCVCVCVCACLCISVIHTSARMGAVPLFVHKHQNKRQGEQSQDAGCYGQCHWHRAWGSNRETES